MKRKRLGSLWMFPIKKKYLLSETPDFLSGFPRMNQMPPEIGQRKPHLQTRCEMRVLPIIIPSRVLNQRRAATIRKIFLKCFSRLQILTDRTKIGRASCREREWGAVDGDTERNGRE